MIPRHLGYEFIIFAIVCTVAIFVFPTATGPYCAVHGPVTALLSSRAKLKLWLGMAFSALRLAERTVPINFATQQTVRQMTLLAQSVPREQSTILRC
jgi:hypothetical protein